MTCRDAENPVTANYSNLGVTSVTLVSDRYDCEISTKQLERDRRTGRETTPTYYVISGRRRVPNYRKFMKNATNKSALADARGIDRFSYTDPQGTPMAYAGRRFHKWPVGKGC